MFQFGNVVVVDGNLIGCIVKSWNDGTHDVYVRSQNTVRNFKSSEIRHYIYSKEIEDDDPQWNPP